MHTATAALIRETFPVGPLQCNCTIIGDPLTGKALVVDPGATGADHGAAGGARLRLVSIIHTHAHLDHFLASGQMKERTGATLHLHKDAQFLWDNLELQCRMFGVPYTPCRHRIAGCPTTRSWPAAAGWRCTRPGIRRVR